MNLLFDSLGRVKKQHFFTDFNSTLSADIRNQDVSAGYPLEMVDRSENVRTAGALLVCGRGGVAINPTQADCMLVSGIDPEQYDIARDIITRFRTLTDWTREAGFGGSWNSGSGFEPKSIVRDNSGEYALNFLRAKGLEFEVIDSGQTVMVKDRDTLVLDNASVPQSQIGNVPVGCVNLIISHCFSDPLYETIDSKPANQFTWVTIKCPVLLAMGLRVLSIGGYDTRGASYHSVGFGVIKMAYEGGSDVLRFPAYSHKVTQTTTYDKWIELESPNTNVSLLDGAVTSSAGEYGAGGLSQMGTVAVRIFNYAIPPLVESIVFVGDYSLSGFIEDESLTIVVGAQSTVSFNILGSTLNALSDNSDRDDEFAISSEDRLALADRVITSVLLSKNLGIPRARLADLDVEKEAVKNDSSLFDELYREADIAKQVTSLTFGEGFALLPSRKDTQWAHFFSTVDRDPLATYALELGGTVTDPTFKFEVGDEVVFDGLLSDLLDNQRQLVVEAELSGVAIRDPGGLFGSRDEAFSRVTGLPLEQFGNPIMTDPQKHFDEAFQRRFYQSLSPEHPSVRAATALSQVVGSKKTFTDIASGAMAYWGISSRRVSSLVDSSRSSHAQGVTVIDIEGVNYLQFGDDEYLSAGSGDQSSNVTLQTVLSYLNSRLSSETNNTNLTDGFSESAALFSASSSIFLGFGAVKTQTAGYGPIWDYRGGQDMRADGSGINTPEQLDFATFADMIKKGFRNFSNNSTVQFHKDAIIDWFKAVAPIDYLTIVGNAPVVLNDTDYSNIGIANWVNQRAISSRTDLVDGFGNYPLMVIDITSSAVSIGLTVTYAGDGSSNSNSSYQERISLANSIGEMGLMVTGDTGAVQDLVAFVSINEAVEYCRQYAVDNGLTLKTGQLGVDQAISTVNDDDSVFVSAIADSIQEPVVNAFTGISHSANAFGYDYL